MAVTPNYDIESRYIQVIKLRDNLTSGRNLFDNSNKPTEVPTCSKNTECPPSGKRSPEFSRSFADTEGLAQGQDDNGSFSRDGAEGEIK